MGFAPILAVAGAALEGFGKFKAAAYQAAVARNNFTAAKQNAVAASTKAQVEQMRSDREYLGLQGEQEAAAAASGLDILGHTQLAIRNSTLRQQAEASGDIRQGGEAQIKKFRSDMKGFRKQAQAASTEAFLTIPQTLVSGARSYMKAGG